MAQAPDITLRSAGSGDAPAIAALHADSWRRHYRGAYADAFLDGDVEDDRLAVWTGRLARPGAGSITVVAEDSGGIVGFAHAVLDDDAEWGTLLDNLHVSYTRKRDGIGTHLMANVARRLIEVAADTGLYLWVLEQNTAAQAFYDARSGRPLDRRPVPPPGGVAGRLMGAPMALRYVWPDTACLLV